MVVAFFLPALILLTGLLVPLGLVDTAVLSLSRAQDFAQSWWGKCFLVMMISLTLFHAAHRIHHGLHDLHVKIPNWLGALVCYGGACLLSALALGLCMVTG